MNQIEFNFRGKRYAIKKPGIFAAVGFTFVMVILISVIIASTSKKNEKTESDEPIATAETENYDASAGVLDKTKYAGTVLEAGEDAGSEYVDSTLFLGDSNTARFLTVPDPDTKKTFTTKNNTIGVVGMGIDAIAAFPCMDFSTGRFSMPQSVKILQPERVIITMGTNNLNGSSTDAASFIERYSAGIRAIQDAYPSVDIIVNSLPPISKTTTYTNVKMAQIDAYNDAIAKMCQDNQWKYLDSAEELKDETSGYAKEGYMVPDGLHLSEKGLQALFKYIRTHAYITEDDRPKPLADIPNIIGVPEGLIKTDPLTETEFTADPSSAQFQTEPTPEPTETPQEVQETPEPTPTPSATPTASAEPTPTPDPKEKECTDNGGTWMNGACSWPTPTPTPTPTPEAEETPEPTPTPALTPDPKEKECADNGGTWANGSCVMPNPEGTTGDNGTAVDGNQENTGDASQSESTSNGGGTTVTDESIGGDMDPNAQTADTELTPVETVE